MSRRASADGRPHCLRAPLEPALVDVRCVLGWDAPPPRRHAGAAAGSVPAAGPSKTLVEQSGGGVR
ncbi:hypothetical protein [Streptomyces sp. NPDC096105]|uniref:hypothetical protein n=1 Tax=Streptomyces sp. NPDC096105 TaxID=3366074 RepID=UPI00381F1C56